MLTLIDEHTRECLAIDVARSLTSEDVLERLSDLFVRRGVPTYIRSDNGSEFTATKVREWLERVGVKTLFIEPGSPGRTATSRSFNGKLRDELLGREQFDTLLEAKVLIERWRRHLQHRPAAQLLGLPGPGAGGDPACFARFGYASASEAGWRWDMPNSNLTIGSLPGGRSMPSFREAIAFGELTTTAQLFLGGEVDVIQPVSSSLSATGRWVDQ